MCRPSNRGYAVCYDCDRKRNLENRRAKILQEKKEKIFKLCEDIELKEELERRGWTVEATKIIQTICFKNY